MKKFLHLIFIGYISQVSAQFAGPVGDLSTMAIHKDSSIFVSWATGCKVVRGWKDIADTTLGKTSVGDSTKALGKADGTGVVSLGDGGYAVLTFTAPIKDGPGFDFAVFENSFNGTFLELAFVEVSSDGVNFFRFPSVCLLQDTVQYDNAANMDCRKIHNLAGKYLANYGTPFDLSELSGIPGLDVNNITHVKIIDVVGSIQLAYARYDSQGHIINDPYPTPFASGGFDLDAVGVIHQNLTGIQEIEQLVKINLYPNPFTEKIYIKKDINQVIHLEIFNVSGEKVFEKDLEQDVEILDLSILSQGQYFAIFQTEHRRKLFQLIKQ
ncbi:MAG TPA: T9SS type A sorting domain-containing protein [Bacteroidia bacterium]|nr:T9SS type A sorting domain-containing protein [Bacteroidia bacterium]